MSIYDDILLLQQQMATVQSDITTINGNISALESATNTLESEIDTLEGATSDSGWINLPLNDGWSMNGYASEVPQYRKIGKIVMLRGLVNATPAADRIIATLPEGFRPAQGWYNRYNSVLNQSEYVNVQVNANGQILDYTKTTSVGRGFLSLNNIVFMTN